jgi:hypothetical protein
MPPRLRASDYAKGKISQDEIIALQIANDANIAKARKALKMGEIQQPTPAQVASPDELIADVASQEAAARSNLERLGFRPQEAAQIVTNIRIDPTLDFVSLNANFPAIEADIKKRFNVKLLTPTFFLDYFRKYSQELEGTTGMKVFDTGVNGLVNTIGELREVLPSKEQVKALRALVGNLTRVTSQRALLNPILERINELERALPSAVDYGRIEQLGAVERERIIGQIVNTTENLPTREQMNQLIREVEAGDRNAIQRLNELANSIPINLDARLGYIMTDVMEMKKELSDVYNSQLEQETLLRQARGPTAVGVEALATTEGREMADRRGDRASVASQIYNETEFRALNMADKRKYLTSTGLSKFLDMPVSQLKTTNFPDDIYYLVTLYNYYNGDLELIDKTIKGEGLPSKPTKPSPKIKLKVGRGLSVKQTPSYREYGKYAIHIPQLEQQDILNVKYKSLGQIPKFKPIPVSDVFRDFILDLLENGKPNARVYTQIAPEERKFFEEMSIGAGVWNGLGLKRTTTSTDEEENKRFEILRGEYMAGNNNPKVISELRKLVVKMMNDGRIRKNQGVEL